MSGRNVPRGLRNAGNTCYQNVVLQSLASVSSFHVYLAAQPSAVRQQPVFKALSSTLQALSVQHSDVAMDSELLRAQAITSRFPRLEQQDAHEFMQFVMNVLCDESRQCVEGCRELFSAGRGLQLDAGQRSSGDGPLGPMPPRVLRSILLPPDGDAIRRSYSNMSLSSGVSSATASACATPDGSQTPPSSPQSLHSSSSFAASPLSSVRQASNAAEELERRFGAKLRQWEKLSASSSSSGHRPRNPFDGLLKSTLRCCTCRNESKTYQKFLDLSLSIPAGPIVAGKRLRPTVEECLADFSIEERISDVECSKCTREQQHKQPANGNGNSVEATAKAKPVKGDAKKSLKIARAPPGLCLHLRRLVTTTAGYYSKVEQLVEFGPELDLTRFCSFSDGGRPVGSSLKYDLVSVVVHQAYGSGGHYKVYRKLLWDTAPADGNYLPWIQQLTGSNILPVSDQQPQQGSLTHTHTHAQGSLTHTCWQRPLSATFGTTGSLIV
eukprot:TRINITY_DN6070_c0_g1_i1.p1 TRINITY_DN6070_c0_g1~~TRINITY_DN6070_c0_g1_i1.p1  ORF type:complete len:496 (+),score=148.67 TRINITY_DN6070_c0_g1_i1:173-1660(+)